MKIPCEKITKNEKETLVFAKKLAKTIKKGQIVLLSGDLGAGKTVFSKGFVAGKGVKAEVVSPTFTIMNSYSDKVFHYDLYRLNSAMEFEATGAHEMLFGGSAVSLVEWPEKVGFDYFPQGSMVVTIEKINDNERKISVKKKE